jgi:hypothetical protein
MFEDHPLTEKINQAMRLVDDLLRLEVVPDRNKKQLMQLMVLLENNKRRLRRERIND